MRGLESSGFGSFLGADHVDHGVDQRQVCERLREVTQMATGVRVDLLRVQLERAREPEQTLAEMLCPIQFADLDEGGHQPEGTDGERSFFTAQSVVGGVDAIAQDQPLFGELVGDRQHRCPDARIVGRQEAQQRCQQERRVE